MPLTDKVCRALQPDSQVRKYADSGGLHLVVSPGGSKQWRLAYRFGGKQKTLPLGPFPDVSLATARGRRDVAKASLAAGFDPATDDGKGHDSFETVARDWYRAQTFAKSYGPRVLARLENDVFPVIGARRLSAIEAPEVLRVLRLVEERGALETTRRIHQLIGAVFRFGVATGRAFRDPTPDLRGALKTRPRVKHMTKVKSGDLPEFIRSLRANPGSTSDAVEFVLHTFVRTQEIRFATWDEFEGDIWRIPEERMKMRREHIVPLTPQSKLILARLRERSQSKWVLPGIDPRQDKPISENTLLYHIYRLGWHGRATIHGLRGTASTILNESQMWGRDVIEIQLAHSEADEIRGAYNAAEYLPQRKKMMLWWSCYLDSLDEDILV